MAISLLNRRKRKRLGFQDRVRTKEEIDREYSHHAMMYGHTARIMNEHQKMLDHHELKLIELAEEGRKAPSKAPKPEEPPKDPVPA